MTGFVLLFLFLLSQTNGMVLPEVQANLNERRIPKLQVGNSASGERALLSYDLNKSEKTRLFDMVV